MYAPFTESMHQIHNDRVRVRERMCGIWYMKKKKPDGFGGDDEWRTHKHTHTQREREHAV